MTINQSGGLHQYRDGIPAYGLGGVFKKAKKKLKKVVKKTASVATSPIKATYVFGKNVAKGDIGDAFQEAGRVYGKAGKTLTPLVGLVPGIGPVIGAGIGAASSALAGDNRNQILNSGMKGGLSGFVGSQLGGAPGVMDSLSGLGGAAGTGGFGSSAASVGLNPLVDPGLSGVIAGLGGGKMLLGAGLLGTAAAAALMKKPKSGSGDVMSPEQEAYYNLPSQRWDWDKLGSDSSASGMALNEYIANNWNNVMGGQYNTPVQRTWAPGQTPGALPPAYTPAPKFSPTTQMPEWLRQTPYPQLPPLALSPDDPGYARGGLSAVSRRYVQGPGSGREDRINARLSDGEYIMDAETVALLGDGSSKAGAKKLDAMRSEVRQHKGRAMANGGFSGNAKSPLQYLKKVK